VTWDVSALNVGHAPKYLRLDFMTKEYIRSHSIPIQINPNDRGHALKIFI